MTKIVVVDDTNVTLGSADLRDVTWKFDRALVFSNVEPFHVLVTQAGVPYGFYYVGDDLLPCCSGKFASTMGPMHLGETIVFAPGNMQVSVR